MTPQARNLLHIAFVPPNTPRFSELIERLAQDRTIAETRSRDMISGLRRVAKALGLPPVDVPCHGRWLQPRLAKINAASLGLSTKAWQNVVSDARSAMAHIGIVERRISRITDLHPEWRKLWELVLVSKSKTLPPALCRFVHFLSRQGIHPDQVDGKHALAYRDALATNEISKSPDVAYRAAANGWNLATRLIPEWPRISLSLASRQIVFKLDDDAFPALFMREIESLLGQLGAPDPLADDARAKPLRPATLELYRRWIFRFASELHHSGIPVEDITSLRFILEPAIFERGLRQMLTRTDNKATNQIGQIASVLSIVGKIIQIPSDAQEHNSKLAARVAVKKQKGITKKNRTRLRVLQDNRNQQRLILLPERIFARPHGTVKHYTVALAREDAVAIAILLVCPIRVKNLAEIRLDQHLHRPGNGQIFLVFDDDEVKNERHLEFELPQDVVKMIERHLATRSPDLCPSSTTWLFPRRDGTGPIVVSQLANRITKRILRETGLQMNPHLFRHFAVMNWLDANPGGYEVARRLLGHSAVSHVINVYAGLEVKNATKAFSDLMETKKGRRK